MSFRFIAVTLAFILLAFPAMAADLHAARKAGLVGERLDGYVAVLKSTPEAESVAAAVNARRRQEYARISAENKQPADVVAKLAAAQIIQSLEPGDYYQGSDLSWKRR